MQTQQEHEGKEEKKIEKVQLRKKPRQPTFGRQVATGAGKEDNTWLGGEKKKK